MNPNDITASATIVLAIVTIVLAVFAYLTIDEQRKERKLRAYEKLSKICDDIYIAMVHMSDMIAKEKLFPIILYYICDKAKIGQPKVYWNRIVEGLTTPEKDQYDRLIESEANPKNLRKRYYELFYLRATIKMLASKEIYDFWEDFLERTNIFMEHLQYKCTELIPDAENTRSKAECEIIREHSNSILMKRLQFPDIDLARETDEFNVKREAFQRQMNIEMISKFNRISELISALFDP
jgi:hypothetical protein